MEENKTKAIVDIFDKYAHGYESKYMSVEKYHESLDLFCSLLSSRKASVLELACGPGNITKYLLNKISTLQILATDLSPVMLELAEENNPTANFQMLDCKSILSLQTKFDAILCGFGLPYVSREETIKLIEDASKSLNQNGVIYLSTMEDDYTKSGFKASSTNPDDRLYTYYHQADYLTDAFEKNGFEIIDISRVKNLDERNEAVVDLTIIGKLK